MRWPWTRTDQDKKSDQEETRAATTNLSVVVERANLALDRASQVLDEAEKTLKKLGPIKEVNGD